MYSDRTLINRRDVTNDPHSNYRADRDFFLLILKSRVIAAAMTVLGLKHKESQPTTFQIPEDISSISKLQALDILHKAASLVVNTFLFSKGDVDSMINQVLTTHERQEVINNQTLTAEGRFKYDGKSRSKHEMSHQPPPVVPETLFSSPTSSMTAISETSKEMHTDDMFNYNCALLADGLFFLNSLDATSEGDGARIIRQYKYMLLYCKADNQHSAKYALECLYQLFLVYALLSPRDSERFTWNRTAYNGGGRGKNVALDLDVQHSNNYIKQAVKNMGPNLTEKAVSRVCHAEYGARNIIKCVDESLERIAGSGKHGCVSTERDLKELLKRAVQVNAFEKDISRRYTHYLGFERNPFKNLDSSTIYSWISQHKRNVHIGNKAR